LVLFGSLCGWKLQFLRVTFLPIATASGRPKRAKLVSPSARAQTQGWT
jgi:hypothetical protein